MKKTFQIIALFSAFLFYGQSISDFQYILVPKKFKDEKSNKYDLNGLLISKLKAKKFIVFNETFEDRPKENVTSCEILKAEVTDASNMFTNKVSIDFKDCNEKTIASLEGKSTIKEFEEGMRAALTNSLKNLSPSNPTDQNLVAKQESTPVNTQTVQQGNTKTETTNINTSISESVNIAENNKVSQTVGTIVKAEDVATKAEIYSNGTLTLNKIILGNGEFILVNPNNSIPYATFKPSAKKNVFRVQLQNGTTTLGYLEGGKILVEIPNADGSFKNEEFLKK